MRSDETNCKVCGGSSRVCYADICLQCGARVRPSAGRRFSSQIGSWRLHTLLGEGSGHESWWASDTRDGSFVTVKLSPCLRPIDERWRALNHPALARLLAASRQSLDGETIGIEVWTWAPGISLRKRQNLDRIGTAAPLYLADRCAIAAHIFAGLRHLHELGMAHGDLRAENVIVRQELTELPGPGRYRPAYRYTVTLIDPRVSPDLDAARCHDQRQLAILLYELLTASLPIAGQPWPEEEYPFLGAGLDEVLKRAMALEGRAQFPDLAALETAWNAALSHGTGYDFALFGKIVGYERFYCESDYYS